MSEENSNQIVSSGTELQERYALGERNFRKAKLAAADLKDIDMCGVDLQSANLKGADLRGADLKEANLKGASLKESQLSRANFSAAKLEGANLSGANLDLAMLQRANLQRTNLKGASMSGAMLRMANLETADLTLADLSDVYMSEQGGGGGANLEDANLKGANLSRANLRGADLRGADLRDANLKGTLTQGAYYDAKTRFPDGFDPVKMGMHKLATTVKKSNNSAQGLKLANLKLNGRQRYNLFVLASFAIVLAPIIIFNILGSKDIDKPQPNLIVDDSALTQTDQSPTDQSSTDQSPTQTTPKASPSSVTSTPKHNSSANNPKQRTCTSSSRKPPQSLSIALVQVPCYGWRGHPVLSDSSHLYEDGNCIRKIRHRETSNLKGADLSTTSLR